jgi:nitrous oxidase accessory protein NosD
VDPNAVGVSDLRDGTDPNEPLQTVAAALTHCGAYQNDVIVVAASSYWTHADTTVGRATPVNEEVTVTVPGVRIVGLFPSGTLGVPWLPVTDTGVCITVHAMDVLIEGFCFWDDVGLTAPVGIYALWDGTDAHGDNLTVRNCMFYDMEFGIQLDYSYHSYIENNLFHSITDTAIDNLSVEGDPDYLIVRDNDFMSCATAMDVATTSYMHIERNVLNDCATGIVITNGGGVVIQDNKIHTTASTGVVAISGVGADECVIHGNVVTGNPAGTNNLINLTGGTGNMVSDNWLTCTIAQYDTTCSDATSGSWVNNHCTNGDGRCGPADLGGRRDATPETKDEQHRPQVRHAPLGGPALGRGWLRPTGRPSGGLGRGAAGRRGRRAGHGEEDPQGARRR